MTSRPALILQRELYRIEKVKHLCPGLVIQLIRNSLFHWRVTLHGLAGSIWEGGIFDVDFVFGPNYDEEPPTVFFVTVPFHPNIDMMNGQPCLDILTSGYWDPSISLIHLIVHLQVLLSHPHVDEFVNEPAADIFKNAPRMYNQIVQDCIMASRQIQEGIPPHEVRELVGEYNQEIDREEDLDANKDAQHSHLSIQRLSFDDYYESWKSLATSKTDPILNRTQNLKNRWHLLEEVIETQKHLIYGHFKPLLLKNNKKKRNTKKQDSIESMRRMYGMDTKPNSLENSKKVIGEQVSENASQERKSSIPFDQSQQQDSALPELPLKSKEVSRTQTPHSDVLSFSEHGQIDEPPEDEVDALVDWSTQLSEEQLLAV